MVQFWIDFSFKVSLYILIFSSAVIPLVFIVMYVHDATPPRQSWTLLQCYIYYL